MRLTTYQPTEGGIPYVVVKDEQDALQKLAAYEDAEEQGRLVIPRWIPVTERLPEERMAVIVYAPYMKNEFMAYWTGSRWMVWAAGECEREMPDYHQITHWMPLPQPPTECRQMVTDSNQVRGKK